MPRASIDIGSNSVVFLVLDDDGGIVYDDAEVVSLGKGLALNHAFLPDRMDAALQTIASYAEVATQHGVRPSDICAIATSASRRAGNAETSTRASGARLAYPCVSSAASRKPSSHGEAHSMA